MERGLWIGRGLSLCPVLSPLLSRPLFLAELLAEILN